MNATAATTDARKLRIETPRVMLPLLAPARYKAAYGGRGGTKSWCFADMIIERMVMDPDLRVVCVREIQKSLKQSVKNLIENRIKALDVGYLFESRESEIRAVKGSGTILFIGMQQHTSDSVRSLEGIDIAWVEEAAALSQNSLDLLRPTIRKEGSELYFSWNPESPENPVDKFFRGPDGPPPDSVVVRTSFEDNPWLPKTLSDEIAYDRRRDPEKFQHIWNGAYLSKSEARVFKNWKVDAFESPKASVGADGQPTVVFLYGADWGFSVDPSVLVRCYAVGRTLYIDQEAYRIGVEVDHLPALFDQVPGARDWTITADSARPETISYLQRHGFPKMVAATKGKDSVKEGVIFLQNFDIVVHPRCVHTVDELTLYSFIKDKLTGLVTPVLEDKKNHVIDSLRYSVEKLRRETGGFAVW